MNSKEVLSYFSKMKSDYLKGRVIGLIGGLGVGKTHFVRTVLEILDRSLIGQITSPTYNLCNFYRSPNLEIHHYDLYRIESEEQLYDTGILESIENKTLLVFIEWVDIFPALMNACDDLVTINVDDQDQRIYLLQQI